MQYVWLSSTISLTGIVDWPSPNILMADWKTCSSLAASAAADDELATADPEDLDAAADTDNVDDLDAADAEERAAAAELDATTADDAASAAETTC